MIPYPKPKKNNPISFCSIAQLVLCILLLLFIFRDLWYTIFIKFGYLIKKLKENAAILGLIFSIVSAVFIIVLSIMFFTEQRLKNRLFDAGVDSVGSLFCAALFFGCMKQDGNGIGNLRSLIVLVSTNFAVNEAICYTGSVPEQSTICFTLCLISCISCGILCLAGSSISTCIICGSATTCKSGQGSCSEREGNDY